MRLLIALAEPHLPQQAGGSQTSAAELASSLMDRGHDVRIAARLMRKSAMSLITSMPRMLAHRRSYVVDLHRGTRVYRVAWIEQNIREALIDFEPDAVILHAMAAMPLAHMISSLGCPLVVYWRDAEHDSLHGTPDGLRAEYLANSRFTAKLYEDLFDVRSVVAPPLIRRDRYISPHHSRETVLFVNPEPVKGVEVAFGVAAACPEIPFEFVESWVIPPTRRRLLEARIATLPNVRLTRRQGSMLGVYGRAKLLLAPSQWQEAWGRVATEAHFNGIPVIGSRIGGLEEAIGPGGVMLAPDKPIDQWAAAVREAWHNEARWQGLSQAALDYSTRPEIDPERILDRILEVVDAAVASHAPGMRREADAHTPHAATSA